MFNGEQTGKTPTVDVEPLKKTLEQLINQITQVISLELVKFHKLFDAIQSMEQTTSSTTIDTELVSNEAFDSLNYMQAKAAYKKSSLEMVRGCTKRKYTIQLKDLSSGRETLVTALEANSNQDKEKIRSRGFMEIKMENSDKTNGLPVGKLVLFVPPNEGAMLLLKAAKDPLTVSYAVIQRQVITGE